MSAKKVSKARTAAVIIIIMLIIVAMTAVLNNGGIGGVEDSDSVTVLFTDSEGAEQSVVFSIDSLKEMEAVTITKNIVAASRSDETGKFTGVPLREVLRAADPELTERCESVVARSIDSFRQEFLIEDIMKDDDIIVCYEKDGKEIKGSREGGTGPLKVVLESDTYGNRTVMFLCDLTVK